MIELLEDVVREVTVAVLWLGAGVVAFGVGSAFAVLGVGTALRGQMRALGLEASLPIVLEALRLSHRPREAESRPQHRDHRDRTASG